MLRRNEDAAKTAEFQGHALNSHGNYIVDHGKNHGNVFLNFCGNPVDWKPLDWYFCKK